MTYATQSTNEIKTLHIEADPLKKSQSQFLLLSLNI